MIYRFLLCFQYLTVYVCLQQQEQDPTNLYIANLPAFMTESDLETSFSKFGNVISTRILRDPNGVSRGVGFARMESADACQAIIQAYNGKILPGTRCHAHIFNHNTRT